MKNIYKYLLIFTASALVVSCGESDLEPTLALDKDLDSGINSAADLGFVLNSAYDRMSVSGYYGRDQIIMGEVRTDNAFANGNSGRFARSDMDYLPNGFGPWASIYRVIESLVKTLFQENFVLTMKTMLFMIVVIKN